MMETKTPRIPPNLPYPVVFGPSFPDFTMTTRGGRQVFSSRTNQNLFLNHWDFTDSGTFTMATLLKKTSTWQECWPLVWDHVWIGDGGEFVDWAYFLEEPRWDDSDAFQRLLGFCQWELHMGHGDLSFTRRVYVHLDSSDGPDPELLDELAGCGDSQASPLAAASYGTANDPETLTPA
jgi:hypothetical protein